MKNYSSSRANKGKIAYRTPSRFIAKKTIYERKPNFRQWDLAARLEYRRKDKKRK